MKIPKYIQEHIEKNNLLLEKAYKHAVIVENWYYYQLEKLNKNETDICEEKFGDIKINSLDNGKFILSAIRENLELLRNEQKGGAE